MTLAAQQLGLTPAAVSAAVQRIERAIGVRLLERTTRSLRLTDEGRLVLEGCRSMADVWRRTLDGARGLRTELEGTLHVSAPADTTYQLLESIIAELCSEHRGLRVVLDTSDAIHHLHRDALDMAIRYGPLQDSTLAARKLAELPNVLVAAPSYLASRGAPETPASLAAHRCLTLQLSGEPVVAWQLHGRRALHTVALDSPLCSDGYLARRWAIAGMGVALKSLFDVIDDLEDGRLVLVLPGYTGGMLPIHAVFPSRQFQTARVRALYAAIASRFASRVARCRRWYAAAASSSA